MASSDETKNDGAAAATSNSKEWKTEGHPWVDTRLQVACSWGFPSMSSKGTMEGLVGSMVAFGPVDENQRKPAMGRVLVDPPPQPPAENNDTSSKAENNNAVLALDLTGAEIQSLQTQTNASVANASANDASANGSTAVTNRAPVVLRLDSSFPNSTLIQNVQERYDARLEQYMKESILPPLVALAALEEATHQLVQQRIAQEDAAETARARRRSAGSSSNNSKAMLLTATPHPPLFYAKPPNQYMTAPSVLAAGDGGNDEHHYDTSSGDPTKEYLSSSPSAWLARIKVGCLQAQNDYLTQQQHEQQLRHMYNTQMQLMMAANSGGGDTIIELSSGRRSSSRIHRIATEQWEEQKASLMDKRTSRSSRRGGGGGGGGNKNTSGSEAYNQGVEAYLKGNRIASFLQKQWELEQRGGGGGEEEEEEETAEGEESEEDPDHDDDEEEDDMDLFNPHLQPTYGDVLKFLRKVRLDDIQASIPYWCQETHNRLSHKQRKKLQQQLDSDNEDDDDDDEMENVLDVDVLPLDSLILGIPEEEHEEAEEEAGSKIEVEETTSTEKKEVAIETPKSTDTTESTAVVVEAAVKSEETSGAGMISASTATSSATNATTATSANGGTAPPSAAPEPMKIEETNGCTAPAKVESDASDGIKADTNASAFLEAKKVEPVASATAMAAEWNLEAKDKTLIGSAADSAAVKSDEPEASKNGDTGSVTKEESPEEATSASESVILQWEVPSSVEKAPPQKQVYKYLQNEDNTTFGRFKFALRRKDEELERLQAEIAAVAAVPDDGQIQRELDEQAKRKEAERAFQTEKSWNKWRFEGIHGGYTVWPKWQHAVKKWQEERNAKEAASATAPSMDIIVPSEEGKASAAQEEADRAKALELAEKEKEEEAAAGASSRRTRRKANSSIGTVFYGQSSQLTAKQLVELILRLCSEKSTAPTIFQLESIVSEDGTQDPVKRLRTALGKLVWRRNQLARLTPCTSWTDKFLREFVNHKSLLQISHEEAAVAEASTVPADAAAATHADVEMKLAQGNKNEGQDKKEAKEKSLLQYIRSVHETELRLRKVVLEHLTEIPIPIVATAADERKNSNEGYDSLDFEDQSSISWQTEGHPWIGKHIFRPRQMANTNDLSQCEWFTIKSFVPSVACENAEEITVVAGSSAKEPPLVDRRMRFRAMPFVEEDDGVAFEDGECLVLTEGQVQAGCKAADLEQINIDMEVEDEEANIIDHPFAGSGGNTKITLYLADNSSPDPIHCTVVGHTSVVGDANKETTHRILVLPIGTDSEPTPDAVWATLDVSNDSDIRCYLDTDSPSKMYRIQQSDFHPESEAFAECRNIIGFLERHNKAGPFLEPVDYVALGIPDYPQVVTNPMDVSTVAKKLEDGHYSNIPPKQTAGRSPVARMLNGAFRADIELIFDNSMLYNPPKDWIHESAAAVKKAVARKMDQISHSADLKYKRSGKHMEKQSIYIDEDSDIDYEYESDNDDDDDYGGGFRRKRKRSKGANRPKADDNSTRAMEQGVRLQKTLSETLGLRGPFANFNVDNEAATFSLPPHWGCRRKIPEAQKSEEPADDEDENIQPAAESAYEEQLSELVELTRTIDEAETSGLRRSTRAVGHDEGGSKRGKKGRAPDKEYVMLDEFEQAFVKASEELSNNPAPSTRSDVEYLCERLHDSYYADVYKTVSVSLEQSDLNTMNAEVQGKLEGPLGSFANGSFPPFLGRMIPHSMAKHGKFSWEIRAPFQIPALRWVIRGLIKSGHLGEVEPLEQENLSSGVIMTNHVYYTDNSLQPFEILDSKELARRRRANNEQAASSEDEIELSEYEKLRAERVARNAERLKALGLA